MTYCFLLVFLFLFQDRLNALFMVGNICLFNNNNNNDDDVFRLKFVSAGCGALITPYFLLMLISEI